MSSLNSRSQRLEVSHAKKDCASDSGARPVRSLRNIYDTAPRVWRKMSRLDLVGLQRPFLSLSPSA